MTKIQHDSVPHVVSADLIDSLIKQAATTPMPRARDAAVRQLYSVGVTVHQIAKAYERDLAAGDSILNQRTDADQNAAEETGMWLEWLRGYELALNSLKRIEDAIANVPEKVEAA